MSSISSNPSLNATLLPHDSIEHHGYDDDEETQVMTGYSALPDKLNSSTKSILIQPRDHTTAAANSSCLHDVATSTASSTSSSSSSGSIESSVSSNEAPPCWRSELRILFSLMFPVSMTLAFRVGMNLTDLAVLGHLSTHALSSASVAFVWQNMTSSFLGRGFGATINTLCSQALGANNLKLVGVWFQLGLLLSLLVTVPVSVCWLFTAPVLSRFGVNYEVANDAGLFSKWSIVWLWPLVIYFMIQRYLQSQHRVWAALIINFIFVFVNLLLNIVLVFGVEVNNTTLGGWGFVGSPIATAFSRWGVLLIFLLYAFRYQKYHRATWPHYDSLSHFLHATILHRRRLRIFLVQQTLPVSIGVILESVQLELIAVFAAQLGDVEVATHNAILTFFFFLTAFPLGLLTATSVRVAHHLGANEPRAAQLVARISFVLSFVSSLLIGAIFILARQSIGRLYSNDEEVVEKTSEIAVLVGGAYVGLSAFYTAMAILDGQGRPMVVALSYMIGAWLVSVPLAHIFAFTLNQGLFGLWMGLTAGYMLVTVMVSVFVWRSDWVKLSQEARVRAETKKLQVLQQVGEDDKELPQHGHERLNEGVPPQQEKMEQPADRSKSINAIKQGDGNGDHEENENDESMRLTCASMKFNVAEAAAILNESTTDFEP